MNMINNIFNDLDMFKIIILPILSFIGLLLREFFKNKRELKNKKELEIFKVKKDIIDELSENLSNLKERTHRLFEVYTDLNLNNHEVREMIFDDYRTAYSQYSKNIENYSHYFNKNFFSELEEMRDICYRQGNGFKFFKLNGVIDISDEKYNKYYINNPKLIEDKYELIIENFRVILK